MAGELDREKDRKRRCTDQGIEEGVLEKYEKRGVLDESGD